MRREWRAAGQDVAQVREGAETSPQRVGAAERLVEEMWVRLEIEKGGEKAAEHLLEKTRVPSERGVGQ